MAKQKRYRSFGTFEKEGDRVMDFIIKNFNRIFNESSPPGKDLQKTVIKNLKIDHTNVAQIVKDIVKEEELRKELDFICELAFIRLYASFEAFREDLVREIFNKYPESMPTKDDIPISEIVIWKSIGSVKNFIRDRQSKKKSDSIESWVNFLKNEHKINIPDVIISNLKQSRFLRNIIIHSGGKLDSRRVIDAIKLYDGTITANKYMPRKLDLSMHLFIFQLAHNLILLNSMLRDEFRKK